MDDLIIVGGGPAGSAAARTAGALGLRVRLLDKAVFPRDKPCGGMLTQRTLSQLQQPIPTELRQRDVHGVRLHFGGSVVEVRGPQRLGLLVSRREWDAYMLDQAVEHGARVHMGEAVQSYEERSQFVHVMGKRGVYQGRYVIIAEGAQGYLKYGLQSRPKSHQLAVCVTTHIPASQRIIDAYIQQALDIHLGVARGGYGWVFPHEGYFAVGVGGLASHLSRPRQTMERFLQHCGFTGGHDLQRHLVPAGGVRRRVQSSRVLLAGDAAGFVDPLCGEGIPYAVRSGQLAAECVHELLHGRRPKEVVSYTARCQQAFGSHLRQALYASNVLHRWPNVFLRLLSSSEAAVHRYLGVLRGESTYLQFLSWLVTQVPGLAMKRRRSNGMMSQ